MKPLSYVTQVVGEEPGVDVEGHGGGGMPEHPLDRFDVGAGPHGQTCSGVAEVMDAETR